MIRRPPRVTLTYTSFPYTKLSRSLVGKSDGIVADFRQALDRRFERLEVLFGRVQRGVADEGGLERDARPEDRHEGHVVKAQEHRERVRSEEHTSDLQSLMRHIVCRLLIAKKNIRMNTKQTHTRK